VTVAEPRRAQRNGTVAPDPIKTAQIRFDEFGYPGRYAVVRTDPRSSVYTALLDVEDEEKWWTAFGPLVLEWNLADDDGVPLPQPSAIKKVADLDVRYGVIAFLFTRYLESVRTAAEVPKVSGLGSGSTLTTNGAGPSSA
jgi:hypothetical protein